MTSVRRALALSFLERYLTLVLALASNIILARLLTPEEIGIYSVSLAVIGIAQVLRDFGIGNFLIQEKDLSDDHIRTAFGMSLLLGGGLFLIVLLLAPMAARFYEDERMLQTLRISSLNFAILPFCTISLSLLRRELQFKRLLYVNLVAALVGFCSTIALAWAGFGANSMAISAVATNICVGVGAWVAQAQRRILLPSLSRWRQLLRFGGQSAAVNVVTTVSMDINDLALGKILGFTPVALFSRAQGLVNLFSRDLMGAVRNVAFPAYAQTHRCNGSVEAQYISSVGGVTAFAWPFFGFMALFPLEVLRLLYGPQWDAAAKLVPPLAVAGGLYAASSLISTLLMAAGRMDQVARLELIFQPLRAVIIVAAALVFRSLEACVWAYLLCFIIYVPLSYGVKNASLASDWSALRHQLFCSLKITVVTLALPGALSFWYGLDRAAPMSAGWFAMVILSGILCWVAGLRISEHPLASDPLMQRWMRHFPGLRLTPRRG
ncbi:lipopolysaccharide biosynthesis protein [Aquincola sp. MAHUQ-54]|uniref:Lipopolysaccharide biosynthesis protein n=1 Tax=Aquincola agrisoli TaxID=3119538 RepID=A0AAW9QQI7_9BURK